jgi:hypothetical protein
MAGRPTGRCCGSPTAWEVEVLYRSPVYIYIDWVYELMAAVERTGARRVLIDSLADLRMAAPDETRFREFIYSLTQRISRHGVSILITMEIPDLFHLERLSESALSHRSDNVSCSSTSRRPHDPAEPGHASSRAGQLLQRSLYGMRSERMRSRRNP